MFWVLFAENFLSGCAYNATSLLPPFLTRWGASDAFIGFFNTVGTLMVMIAVIGFNRQLVTLRRVPAIRWGFVVFIVSSLLSWISAPSLVFLALLRVSGSLAQIFTWTVMMSLVLETAPPRQRASRVALYGVAGILTNPVSSALGELASKLWGGPSLFLLATGFGVLALATTAGLREPAGPATLQVPPRFLAILRRKDLRVHFLVTAAFGVYFTAFVSFLPRHTEETLGVANLSAFLAPFSFVSIALRIVFGNRMDQRPPRRFLVWSFASIAISAICLLLPLGWAGLVLAGLFYGIGHSILFPLLNALFVHAGDEEHKASYSNAYMVANLTGAVLGAPLLGALGDAAGFSAILVVLFVVAITSVFLVRSRFPRPAADQPSVRNS